MRKLVFLHIVLMSFRLLAAQDGDAVISGTFTNDSFVEFAERVESTSSLRFYFTDEMVREVLVNGSFVNADPESTLNTILAPYKIHFHRDQNSIILYTGTRIVESIPEFRRSEDPGLRQKSGNENGITSVEQKYLNGRRETRPEEIVIGDPKKTVKGRDVNFRGRVVEEATGKPLIGATVYIEELGVGAATDLDGHFTLVLPPGKYLMTASSLSVSDRSYSVQLYADGFLTIPMESELVDINEVKVVADRNNNVRGMMMGFEFISSRNIREIPMVMGEKDILKVAQMLPGVQSAGEGSSGLIVRGGSADQNLFYINRLPVYNTSHLFGFFSAFSPDIVNNFSLYKSNIPAKYGGRVSSVFDINTRQGNKKKFFGKGGISPVTGHIAVEGPLVKDKCSFVLSYRATYSDWILSRVEDINIRNSNASFYDLSGTVNAEISDKHLLKAFFYRSADRFSLSTTNDYEYANTGGTVSWKYTIAPSMHAEFTAVASLYEFGTNDKTNPSEAYSHDYNLGHYEFRSDFTYIPGSKHRLHYGFNLINYALDRGDILPYGEDSRRIEIDLGLENGLEAAVYISDEISLTPRLSLLAGMRYSLYSLLGPADVFMYSPGVPKTMISIESVRTYDKGEAIKWYHGPEPRAALNYILGENNSVKVSYNRIRQYLFLLSNTIAISPTDQWKLTDYHLKPMVGDQVSCGYYHNLNKQGFTLSAEVYKKWVNNVVEYKDGADFISADPSEMSLLQGKQNVYGAEFMFRKNSGKLTGWLSYSYSRSFILVNDELTGDQINRGEIYPSNYDKPHSLQLVTNYRTSRRLSYSVNVAYSSGRPVTYPAAVYYSGGREILHYSGRNEYRIPDYFRVDLSINYEGNLLEKKWLHSSWSFNVYNLLGRKNVYSVFFEASEGKIQGYKLSVFGQPIFSLTWNFKFGNYASE